MKFSFVLLTGSLILVLIAYFDMVLSYEFGFALFYIIPILYVSWYSGQKLGLFFSCIAAGLWFFVDYYQGHPYEHQYAMLWNTMMRWGIFSLVAYLVSRTHHEMNAVGMLAQKDALTGLYNRRGILSFTQQEIDRTNRYKHAFALVLIDLNQFKMINDVYGHRHGDRALKHVAILLQKNIRQTDVAGRIGGDEFVLLLLDINQEEAVGLVKKIQDEMHAHASKRKKLVASFSAGVLLCGPTKLCALELINQADDLMYQAKNHRKIQVISTILPS
jgi:diguanylate cyclase (GGDEF)-like protein